MRLSTTPPASVLPSLFLLLAFASGPVPAQETSGATADGPFQQALTQLEAGDPEAAIALLEPLRDQAGADPRALTLLGALYVDTGRAAEAQTVLEPLAARQDADPALLFHASRAAQALGRNDKAEEYLVRSVAADPVSPAGRALGLIRALQGRYGQAFQLLYPWTRLEPDDREARLAAAQAAVRLGRVAEARELLGGLDPASPRVRLLQADLAMLLGDARRALETLGPVLDDPPESLAGEIRGLAADAYLLRDQPQQAVELLAGKTGADPRLSLLLARAQRQLSRTEEAVETLRPIAEQLMAAAGSAPTALLPAAIVLDYGRFLAAAGRHQEAVTALEEAAAMNPDSRLAWRSLSESLTALGRREQAGEASRRAEELAQARTATVLPESLSTAPAENGEEIADLDATYQALIAGETERGLELVRQEKGRVPGDPAPQLLEVRILLSMDRSDEALQAAEAAVRSFPGLADALYLRGTVRMARGEAESAERDLRRSVELDPAHTPALNDLAVLLLTQKRRQEAKELLERVLSLRPDDPLAAENLRRLEERLRQEGGGS